MIKLKKAKKRKKKIEEEKEQGEGATPEATRAQNAADDDNASDPSSVITLDDQEVKNIPRLGSSPL